MRGRWTLVLALLTLVAGVIAAATRDGHRSAAPDAPRFVDVTTAAGVAHRYDGDADYFVGGGVAAFDCDDDGRDELYFAGGSQPAALFRNESPMGGELRFRRQPSSVTDLTSVTGAYPLDIDSDGRADLAVLRRGGNVLLRGLGACRFESANDRFGIDGGDAWTVAFSATWEGTNELPTMAFVNYLEPDSYDCASSELVRPEPDEARYAPPIELAPGYCALSALFSDWDRSGGRDLRLTNDRNYYRDGSDQLWRVVPGEAPRLYTERDGWRPLRVWGMGIASQDLTGDGRPEVFITSQGDNKLQTLAGADAGPTYEDIALERGVTAHRPHAGGDALPSTAWHPEFADVNNDGFVDLFITKGNVEAQADYAQRDPNDLLLGRDDGTFVERAQEAGIVSFERARGAALVDLNLDGMLDLVVVNRRENVTVWRSVTPQGHWIAVRLHQSGPNPDAIGAWVEAEIGDRRIDREVTVGGGHAGGQLGWIHVGLGDHERTRIRVVWPDGERGRWLDAPADGFVTIERGATEVERWEPEVQQP